MGNERKDHRSSIVEKYRAANRLKNPGFDDDFDYWNVTGHVHIATFPDDPNKVANFIDDGTLAQFVPELREGGKFVAALDIAAPNATGRLVMFDIGFLGSGPAYRLHFTNLSERPTLALAVFVLDPGEPERLFEVHAASGLVREMFVDNILFAKIDDTVEPEPGEERITNCDFENGVAPWKLTNTQIFEMDDSYQALMHLEASIEQTIDQTLHPLRAGTYVLQFHLIASPHVKDRDGRVEILLDGQPRPNPQTFTLDAPHSRHMVFVLTLTDADIKDHAVGVRIVKVRGTDGDPNILGWRIDNVSLKEIEPSEA